MPYSKRNLQIHKYRKITLSQDIERIYRSFCAALFVLLILLYASYLYIGNTSQAKGYQLKKLQDENNALYYQNKILDKQVIESKAFVKIAKDPKTNSMSAVENSVYAKSTNVAVNVK